MWTNRPHRKPPLRGGEARSRAHLAGRQKMSSVCSQILIVNHTHTAVAVTGWRNKARCFAGDLAVGSKNWRLSRNTNCAGIGLFVSVLWGSKIASLSPVSLTSAPSSLHFECFEAGFATDECATRLWRRSGEAALFMCSALLAVLDAGLKQRWRNSARCATALAASRCMAALASSRGGGHYVRGASAT